MAKFDYCEFGYTLGSFDQLVFNAKKYSQEDAVNIFNNEYGYIGLKAGLNDISAGYVKYFINPPDEVIPDFEGGCYCFVDKPGKGVFPVWVIVLNEL